MRTKVHVYTANELMVDAMFRAALRIDHRSQAGGEAQKRLLALAEAIDPVAFKDAITERDACQAGMARALASFLPNPKPKKKEKSRWVKKST